MGIKQKLVKDIIELRNSIDDVLYKEMFNISLSTSLDNDELLRLYLSKAESADFRPKLLKNLKSVSTSFIRKYRGFYEDKKNNSFFIKMLQNTSLEHFSMLNVSMLLFVIAPVFRRQLLKTEDFNLNVLDMMLYPNDSQKLEKLFNACKSNRKTSLLRLSFLIYLTEQFPFQEKSLFKRLVYIMEEYKTIGHIDFVFTFLEHIRFRKPENEYVESVRKFSTVVNPTVENFLTDWFYNKVPSYPFPFDIHHYLKTTAGYRPLFNLNIPEPLLRNKMYSTPSPAFKASLYKDALNAGELLTFYDNVSLVPDIDFWFETSRDKNDESKFKIERPKKSILETNISRDSLRKVFSDSSVWSKIRLDKNNLDKVIEVTKRLVLPSKGSVHWYNETETMLFLPSGISLGQEIAVEFEEDTRADVFSIQRDEKKNHLSKRQCLNI